MGVLHLIMTYDFILKAQHDKEFMQEIHNAISSGLDSEICTDIHRLRFYGEKKVVIVEPYSENSDFNWKIIPKEITYQAILKMLDGDRDSIGSDDIRDV